MSSIKCNQCGLVNFNSVTNCKRCQQPLNDFASIAAERNYQFSLQNFQMPPAPPIFQENFKHQVESTFHCIKCGNQRNVQLQNFKKKYVSPIASLGILIGILPYFLFRLLLTTIHSISAPFCDDCWNKFRYVEYVSVGLNLGAAITFFLTIYLITVLGSLTIFGIGLCVMLALMISARVYTAKVSPKYNKVDGKQVIINAPIVGELVFTK